MKTLVRSIVAAGLSLSLAASAFADKVVMKDGRVIEGTIIEQTDHFVKIKVAYGDFTKEEVIWMGDVAEVKKEAGATQKGSDASGANPAGSPAATTGATVENNAVASANNPGLLILPLTGMVGVDFRNEEIDLVAAEADRIKKERGIAPIIVLHIESGGGLVHETEFIHDSLMQLKQNHRVVAWVKEAISAACATAIHCDEIYFMSEGNAGAVTAFAGTQSLQGAAREAWIRTLRSWMAEGGRFPGIANAMIGEEFLLSYDKDPVTGVVTWYEDLSGEFVLSREKQNLSFTKSTALHSGFADGWADTPEQLAELLDLQTYHEASTYGKKVHDEWIETCKLAREDIPRTLGRIEIIRASGAADQLEKIGREIRELEKLIRWWERAENVCMYEIAIPPKEVLQQQIDELRRRAAEIRRRQREGGLGGG